MKHAAITLLVLLLVYARVAEGGRADVKISQVGDGTGLCPKARIRAAPIVLAVWNKGFAASFDLPTKMGEPFTKTYHFQTKKVLRKPDEVKRIRKLFTLYQRGYRYQSKYHLYNYEPHERYYIVTLQMGEDGKLDWFDVDGQSAGYPGSQVSMKQAEEWLAEEGDDIDECTNIHCPDGFTHLYRLGRTTHKGGKGFQPSCYKFVNHQENWLDARKKCLALGADLVSIETAGEQHHLASVIKTSPELQRPAGTDSQHWGYWTSGTDEKREGQWKWEATNRKFVYERWGHSQPNNDYWGKPEDCLQMSRYFKYRWNDLPCDVRVVSYICETNSLA